MRGVLVIVHGSSNLEWIAMVDDAVNRVDVDVPIVTSFLEMVEGRSIQEGIYQLEKRGVTRILAVPLFVSAGSTHIQEIRHLLGLQQKIVLEVDEVPLKKNAKIELAPSMDDHPLILEIIERRVQELSVIRQEEVLLLVGHGSRIDEFYAIWTAMMERMAEYLQNRMGLKKVICATLLPNNVAEKMKEHSHESLIVVPLFLSEGYFTKKVIPSRIEGVNCRYSGKAYLPDPLVSEWIREVIMAGISTG